MDILEYANAVIPRACPLRESRQCPIIQYKTKKKKVNKMKQFRETNVKQFL